jgi:anhydro-N-acetylmuramic acid kinase
MHPYFSQNVPKSLDRNAFSAELADLAEMSLPDALATAVGFAAFGVAEAVTRCPIAPAALYLCGGGRHNLVLCDAVRAQVACPVQRVEAIGLNGDMLEAQAFAYLAVRVLRGLPISAPMTTGVSQPISGGRIADPNF